MEPWMVFLLVLSVLVGSGGMGWIISIRVAPAAAKAQAKAMVDAAHETAKAALEAGLKQSLETEKMKLRSSIIQRRLNAFDGYCSRWLEPIVAQISDRETAKELVSRTNLVNVSAVLVVAGGDQETERLGLLAPQLHNDALDFVETLKRPEDDTIHTKAALKMMSTFHELLLTVDWATQRLVGVPPADSPGRLARETVKKLYGTTFSGTDV